MLLQLLFQLYNIGFNYRKLTFGLERASVSLCLRGNNSFSGLS